MSKLSGRFYILVTINRSLTAIIIFISTIFLFSTVKAATLVETVPIHFQDSFFYNKNYSGQVLSKQRSQLGFELDGLLKAILVDEGSYVKKGQPLAELDTKLLTAKLQELTSQKNDINVQLQLANLKAQRIQKLIVNNHVSQQALDEVLTDYYSLKEKIAASQKRIDDVNIRLKKSTLIAPYDGQIVNRLVDEGSVIKASQPILELLDNIHYEAHIGIPQRYEDMIKTGSNVKVTIGGKHYNGTIQAIRYDLSQQTRTINAIIKITPGKKITAKNLASLEIPIIRNEKGFWLPLTALKQNYRGLWSIYTLKKDGDKSIAKQNPVNVLYSNSRCAYANAKIENNTQVIYSGLHKVVPGLAVKAVSKEFNLKKYCHE